MNKKFSLFLVLFVFLHSLRYFDYINYDSTIGGWVTNILSVFLIGFYLVNKFDRESMPTSKSLLLLLLVPILSFLPCWLDRGQSLVESARVYLPHALVLVYFVCHKECISKDRILKAIVFFAVIRTLLIIMQQFTYPNYWFSFRPEMWDDETGQMTNIEVRSGILRFYIEDTYLSMFLLFYYFQKLLNGIEWRALFMFFFGMLGIYLDQSRQFMFSSALSLVIVFLMSSNMKHKAAYAFLLLIIGFVIYSYGDFLFGDLIIRTAEETNENNIRVISYYHYSYEFWEGPLTIVLGNGLPGRSSYGDLCTYFSRSMHLWTSDVGIVGALNLFGIAGVLALLLFYKNFLYKYWSSLDMYLKMFFFSTIINLPLVCVYTQSVNFFIFWGILLYLSDLSIRNSQFNQ